MIHKWRSQGGTNLSLIPMPLCQVRHILSAYRFITVSQMWGWKSRNTHTFVCMWLHFPGTYKFYRFNAQPSPSASCFSNRSRSHAGKSVKSGLSAPARNRDMTCEGCSFYSSPHPLQSRLHFKENVRLVELVKLQDKRYMFVFKPGLLSKKPSKHMTWKNLLLQAFTGTAGGLLRLRKTFFSNLETQGYK